MTNALQKLGETMFRLKWWTVLFWLVVIGVLSVVMVQVGPKTTDSLSIPGTQAQQTLDRFNEIFPDEGASSAKVIIASEDRQVGEYKTGIDQLTRDIATVNEVTTALSPFDVPGAISENGKIAYITVQLKPEGEKISDQTMREIDGYIESARADGLTVVAGGDLVQADLGEILGVGEVIGVVIALLVLVVTLGSLTAAGMPIIIALVTIGASMAGLFALSNTIEVTNTAPVLAVMLGLAVGIDYSLFIVNRYRSYVKEGYSYRQAAGRAVATAGNAVLFAAVTVVIALAALTVVQIPFMTTMGLAAAATVALAAIVAVTLIPSLLGIAGDRVFSRKERRAIKEAQRGAASAPAVAPIELSVWYRLGRRILRHRLPVLIASVVIIGVLALPMGGLKLGLPTAENAAEGSAARQSYDLLAEGFGAGYNSPLLLVVEDLPAPTDADRAAVTREIAKQANVDIEAASQMPPEVQQQMMQQLNQEVEKYLPYYPLKQISDRVAGIEGVQAAQPALVSDDSTKGVIQVVPVAGPSDAGTKRLVEELRSSTIAQDLAAGSSATFAVTGTAVLQMDIDDKLADALPVYLGVVVGLSFIILLVAFRSILIPIKATAGFLLSVFAMFGALVAVFQWGWFGIAEAPGPIVSFIPIIATGILFGLAMDYEFFLVSGMQEAYHKTKKPKEAVVNGFAMGSRVVVAAGLIMVAVFAGFITNHDATIQSIGFALAIGVLVDAFIVRLVIVPIVMSYLGRSAWWIPKWLDKALPNISIEGDESALK